MHTRHSLWRRMLRYMQRCLISLSTALWTKQVALWPFRAEEGFEDRKVAILNRELKAIGVSVVQRLCEFLASWRC